MNLINDINQDGLCAYALIHEPFCSEGAEEEEMTNDFPRDDLSYEPFRRSVDDIVDVYDGTDQLVYDEICANNSHYNFFDDPIFDDSEDDFVADEVVNVEICVDDELSVAHLFFSNIYEKTEIKDLQELILLGSDYEFLITENDCMKIEKITRLQSDADNWFKLRQGRITASNFKSACITKIQKPAISTIKKICYPQGNKFTSKATKYGSINEKVAFDQFHDQMTRIHSDYTQDKVGLFINPKYPAFGASPDGICNCSCCGKRIIEIKCPYTLQSNLSYDSLLKMKDPYIIKDSLDQYSISKKHSYYYQIQMQMFLVETEVCYLVIWADNEMITLEVERDLEFWEEKSQKGMIFFNKVLVPEMLGNFFTENANKLKNN